MRSAPMNVPFELPRSSMTHAPRSSISAACFQLTCESCRQMPLLWITADHQGPVVQRVVAVVPSVPRTVILFTADLVGGAVRAS